MTHSPHFFSAVGARPHFYADAALSAPSQAAGSSLLMLVTALAVLQM